MDNVPIQYLLKTPLVFWCFQGERFQATLTRNGLRRNKSTGNSSMIRQKGESQNFPKNEHFLPTDTHTQIWRALFSCYLSFEVRFLPYICLCWAELDSVLILMHATDSRKAVAVVTIDTKKWHIFIIFTLYSRPFLLKYVPLC